MRNLPPKILPKYFTCIGAQPDDYYSIITDKIVLNPAPGGNPKVVSSVYGKIKMLMLFYPRHKNTRGKSIYCYYSFLKELIAEFKDRGRTFVVVTKKSNTPWKEEAELRKIANENGNRLCHIEIPYRDDTFGVWAQDSFLSVEFEMNDDTQKGEVKRKIYLVESNNPTRENKCVITEIISSLRSINESTNANDDENFCNECDNLNLGKVYSNVPFVGGNILAGEDFMLIGLNQSREDIESTGQEWFGKKIILLYSCNTEFYEKWGRKKELESEKGVVNYFHSFVKHQGIFHLDVFMTLAGKNDKGQEVFVIGQPVVGFPLHKDTNPELLAMIRDIITETSKSIEQMIDQLTAKLGSKPFKIVRNPLPLTYYESSDYSVKKREWTWASYNNCLVENYTDDKGWLIKKAYLPSYGVSSDYSEGGTTKYGDWTELYKYDLENQWIWKKILGYDECILLKQDYNQFMSKQGALNCITNCVERYP